jgi:ubiquinone/menaquinone biosynthesis C-methylase UbiE
LTATLLNIGSGQRRFTPGWHNIDLVSRPGQVPDILADGAQLPYKDGSVKCAVLHHVLEHFGCNEGDQMLKECHRVLAPQGSLIVFVPDLKALAEAWQKGTISSYTYCVNLYGAYQGEESDRHKWGYDYVSLVQAVIKAGSWWMIKPFSWRHIPGADFARDWWITAVEAIK